MPEAILAWRKHPKGVGTLYVEEDLLNEKKVIEIFSSCKTSEAYINADGWEVLYNHYGIKGILDIDSQSLWLIHEDKGEWISAFCYHALNSGYDPIGKEKGDYDVDSGWFYPLAGSKRMINWEKIHGLEGLL